MKLTIDIGLDDLLVEKYDNYEDDLYYCYANQEELKEIIKEKIEKEVSDKIRYNLSSNLDFTKIVRDIVNENKDVIIKEVINRVSTSIFNQKAIKDFKKSLDNN